MLSARITSTIAEAFIYAAILFAIKRQLRVGKAVCKNSAACNVVFALFYSEYFNLIFSKIKYFGLL